MDKVKIHCGDHDIELTRDEIRAVHEYLDFEYLKEDIESHAELVRDTSEEIVSVRNAADVIAERARIYLDKNDGYWDSYWYSIEEAIEDVLKESKE